MLPVSSATICCCCHAKVPVHGGLKSLSPYWYSVDFSSKNFDKSVPNFSTGGHLSQASFKICPASCFDSHYIGQSVKFGSLGNAKQLIQRSYEVGVDQSHHLHPNAIVGASVNSAIDNQLMYIISETIDSADSESVSAFRGVPVDPRQVLDLVSDLDTKYSDTVSKLKESIADKVNGGENVLNSLFDPVNSFLTTTLKSSKEVVDNTINDIFSFINNSGESAGNKFSGLASGTKEASGKAGLIALDVLRGAVVVFENSLVQGTKVVGYAYNSAKEFLPPEFQDVLSSSEESVVKVLNPAGAAFQQVYHAVEGLEQRLGLDPNDPLVSIAVLLGVSVTLWGSFSVLKYSGYAGDLSPKSTFELLRGRENAVLIDIRPENLRERDGIPDLRRAARSRYASVTLPEISDSVRKMLKGGSHVDDSLLAAVIRNLKIVENKSKVLVLDADGSRSKSVARSLKALGIERPYLVEGGFRSWVKEGIRVKMLKPENALTVINEEAEAILEEINPTPLKVLGYGLGLAAAAYSLVEWEWTLQFIGVIGLGQTILRRAASYEGAEDFGQDVRLMLTPVKLGGEAVSWVAGKLETNINGLQTSPTSSDVQSRVLQAAAKHESQPSDTEESQDTENVNISEA